MSTFVKAAPALVGFGVVAPVVVSTSAQVLLLVEPSPGVSAIVVVESVPCVRTQ